MADKKQTKVVQEASLADRSSDYCRTGENAAHYIAGVADALELANLSLPAGKTLGIVHRLRRHAHELDHGTLWVEHGFKQDCK